MTLETKVDKLIQSFWLWRLRNSPEFATSIGIHDFDEQLDEMSMSSFLRRKVEAKHFLQDVKNNLELSKTENLSKPTLLNLQLMQFDLEQYLKGLEFKPFLCPLNRLEGPQLDFPRLLSWMKRNTTEDIKKILSRLRFFPQQTQEIIQLLKEGVRLGITMHKVSIESIPKVLLQIASDPVEKLPLFKPFNDRPVNIPSNTWTALVAEAKEVIESEIQPSYKSLANFLITQYFPKTRENVSASSLPNGDHYYEECLKFHTSTTLTPLEIHKIGQNEVARITSRMENVKDEMAFTGDLKSFRHFMRADSKFKFKDSQDIVSHYQKLSEDITKVLPQLFKRLPQAKFEITPMPAAAAPTMPGAYYLAPPQDASRPGTFYINTYKAEDRLKYEAVSLCLHEAEPGHHLQSSLTMETGSLVSFRRFMEDRKYYQAPGRFAINTAYVEGWGLYSEFLGEELGLYKEPSDLFGRFSHEMLRACRLVVDTGLHALGWSREAAIEFMMENTATDLNDVISEIDRYITWPGQACGYKIGEIKIKELRKKWEDKLGNKFCVKELHDLIVSLGGVPLDILEKQVDMLMTQ